MSPKELRFRLMDLVVGVEEVKLEENCTGDTCDGIAPRSVRVTVTGGDEKEISKVLALYAPPYIAFVGEVEWEIEVFGNMRLVRFSRGERSA